MQLSLQSANLPRIASSYDAASNSTRLIYTRWAAGGVVLLATAVGTHGLGLALPEGALYAVGILILAYNLVFHFWQRTRLPALDDPRFESRMQRLVLWQIALDWLSMSVFLHFTGGITSPAVVFFFIHVVMVTVALPGHGPDYAGLAVFMVGVLAVAEASGILAHYAVIPGIPANLHTNTYFVAAQIVFLGVGLFASVFITKAIVARLRQRERQIEALLSTVQDVNSSLDLSVVLERLVSQAAQALSVRAASIRLLDADGQYLELAAAHGLSQNYLDKGDVHLSGSQLDRQALSGQALILCDPGHDPRVQYPAEMAAEGIQSLLVAPIISPSRQLGVIRLYNDQPNCFSEDDGAFLIAIAQQGAIAIENALAHEKLAAADQERAQFVRTVTHELRAPVTGAQSLLRVLARGMAGDLTDQQQDITRRLETRLESLLALINDLLTFAASRTMEHHQATVPVALNAALQAVQERQQPPALEKQVTLTFDLPADPVTVCATEDGLARIFDNLVGNAVKYTPSGGTVRVTVTAQPDSVLTTISDTGIGIPQDVIDRLGEEFLRAQNAKEAGITGTGLGMAIVKQHLARYNGCMQIESTLGSGTTIRVTLPRIANPA